MTTPWNGFDDAFTPMFSEPVVITSSQGNNNISQTVVCCVLSSTTDEPYSDEMMDTNRVELDFVCNRKDWKFLSMVHRGDTLVRQGIFNKPKYTVQTVKEDDVLGIIIKAKSV